MLQFTYGDMFLLRADVRVNAVNCVGVMGAGVASLFARRYPAMVPEYKRACETGALRPGKLHIWSTADVAIVNLPTKVHWRGTSKYDYVDTGLAALRTWLDMFTPGLCVTLPALGCGLGGLEWPRVQEMITARLGDADHDVWAFTPADTLRSPAPADAPKG